MKRWNFKELELHQIQACLQERRVVLIQGDNMHDLQLLKHYLSAMTGIKDFEDQIYQSIEELFLAVEHPKAKIILFYINVHDSDFELYLEIQKNIVESIYAGIGVFIELNDHKVLHYHYQSLHDIILRQATDRLKQYELEHNGNVPYDLRKYTLDKLPLVEQMAVRLAYMNTGIERGGIMGWYQTGELVITDIAPLKSYALIGCKHRIQGSEWFQNWLISVEFALNQMTKSKNIDKELASIKSLERVYGYWEDRINYFDTLISIINTSSRVNKSKIEV